MLIMDECESVSAVECMSDSRERGVGGHAAVHGESPLVFVRLLGSSHAGLRGADFY